MNDERCVMEAEWRGTSRDSPTDSLNGPSYSSISPAYGNVNRHATVYPDSQKNYEENENYGSCFACCKPKKVGYYDGRPTKYRLNYASIDFHQDANEVKQKKESQYSENGSYKTRDILGYLNTMPHSESGYGQKTIKGPYQSNYTPVTNNQTECVPEDEPLLRAFPKSNKRTSHPIHLRQTSFDKHERINETDVPSEFSYIKSVKSDFMVEDKAFLQTFPKTSNEASSIQDFPFRSLYSAEPIKYFDKATQTDIKGFENDLPWIVKEKSEEVYNPNEIPPFSSLRSLGHLSTVTQFNKSYNIPENRDSKDEYLLWTEKRSEPEIEPYLNFVTIYKDDAKKQIVVNTIFKDFGVNEKVEELYDPFFTSPLEGSQQDPVKPLYESKIKLPEIVPKTASLTKNSPKVALIKANKSSEADSFDWLYDKVNNLKQSYGTSFESLPPETVYGNNILKMLKENDHLLTNASEMKKQSQLNYLKNEEKNKLSSDSLRFSYSNSLKSSNLLEKENAEIVRNRPRNMNKDHFQQFKDRERSNSETSNSLSDMDNRYVDNQQPKVKVITKIDHEMEDRPIPVQKNYMGSPYDYDGQVRERRKGEEPAPPNCEMITGTKVTVEAVEFSHPKPKPKPKPKYTCPEPLEPPPKCPPPPVKEPEPKRPSPMCLGKIGNDYIRNCYPPLCDNSHRRCYQCPEQKHFGNRNDCFKPFENTCGGIPPNFMSRQLCSRNCFCEQPSFQTMGRRGYCSQPRYRDDINQCFDDYIPSCRSYLSATRYCKPVQSPQHCCQSNQETSDKTNCTDEISQMDKSYDFIMNTYDNLLAWINKCSSKDIPTNSCPEQDFHSDDFQRDNPCFKIEVSETPCGKEKIVINKI